MYRLPKRWLGSGGAYDINGILQTRQVYTQGAAFPDAPTNIDPNLYRYIGKFTLATTLWADVFTPPPNTFVLKLNSNINEWIHVIDFSFDITSVNGKNKLADFFQGVFMGTGPIKRFIFRSRYSNSSFTAKIPLSVLYGSTTDNTNFNINMADTNQRANVKIITMAPASFTTTGVPKPGEEYDLYWIDENAHTRFNPVNQSESVVAQMLSTIGSQSTTVATYQKTYSTLLDAVNYSSMISSTYITDIDTAAKMMEISTGTFSTTLYEFSTHAARYNSTLSTLSSATAAISSISTLAGLSTPGFQVELSTLKPEFDNLTQAFFFSTSLYDSFWYRFKALSTSSDVMNAVRDTFRSQSINNAISTLNSVYPNLSTILLSTTGNRALYQRGGADPTEDQLFLSAFPGDRISTFIQTMMDEQTQFAILSTFSSVWAVESAERAERLSSISSVQVSSGQLLTESIEAGNLAKQYETYYNSTIAEIIPYVTTSTLEAKKMSLYNLDIDITKKTLEIANANENIQIAENMLELLETNLSDPYELFMDQIPKQYAPLVPNSEIPDPQWKQKMTIEIADPKNMWRTRDYQTLWNSYGRNGRAPFYFTYEGKQFYILFISGPSTNLNQQPITLMVDREGTGNWVAATSTDIPMSADVEGLASSYYTYKTISIEVRSVSLLFTDTSYTLNINNTNSQQLIDKYGLNNPIPFTIAGNPGKYMLLYTDNANINKVSISKLVNSVWTRSFRTSELGSRTLLSILPEPMITTIIFNSQTSLRKSDYYSVLFKKFASSSVYFLHTDSSNSTRLFQLKFSTITGTTTHNVTIEQWLRTNTWGPSEIQFPIGVNVPIQLTIGITTTTEVAAQKEIFVGKRDTLRGELNAMILQKDAIERDVGQNIKNVSSIAIESWSNWVTSTLQVEAQTFEDYQQNLKDASTLFLAYQASTSQMVSDAFIEEKRQSTFRAYDNFMRFSLSTYQSRINTMFAVESALQSTIRALQENWSDITNDKMRCAEIRSLWRSYLADYETLRTEYNSLTQKRMDIANSSGRPFIPSPVVPSISDMSNFPESACNTVNFVSDLSYRIQTQEGGVLSTQTLSSINTVRFTLSSLSMRTVSSVIDTQTALRQQVEALALYNVASQNYTEIRKDQLEQEMLSFRNTLLELSTQATYGIADWRYKQVRDPQFSTMNTAGLTYMRYLRGEMGKFISAMENEKALREQYADLLAKYNDQQYRIKGRLENALPVEQFRELGTTLDITIGTCNSYTRYRKMLYDDLQSKIQYASTMRYFVGDSVGQIYNSTMITYDGNQKYMLEPRFPIPMNFKELPPRVIAFKPGGVLPAPIPPCVPIEAASTTPVTRPTGVEPTTTLDTRACGVKARFVEFTDIPNGMFEAVQILVIDKDGRNVAFGKEARLLPGNTNTYILTNGGAYSPEMAARLGTTTQIFLASGIQTVRIDLGTEIDITAVRYMKAAASQYNPSVIRVSLKNTDYVEVASKRLFVNLAQVVLDFRAAASNVCAITVLPTRYGTCGLMARYVRVLPPNPFPPMFQFQLSQIVVVNEKGENVTTGSVRFYSVNNRSQPTLISDYLNTKTITGIRTYRARALARSEAPPFLQTSATGFLEIDLGSEQDIVAIHLHGVTDNLNLINMRVQLFTDDMLQAGNDGVVTGNRQQEIVDFTYASADKNCSTVLKWPAFYGRAGIIASGIQISQDAGVALQFGTIRVIDRAGRNVTLFRDVEVNPGIDYPSKMVAVQEAADPANISLIFNMLVSNTRPYAKVMFEKPSEICAVYVIARSGEGRMLQKIQVELLGADGTVLKDGANTASFIIDSANTLDSIFFDTRYNPDTSEFPTKETTPIVRNGQFGIYAQNVRIQPLPPVPVRTRSDLMNTDLSANAIAYTLALSSPTALWKTLDYPKLLGTFERGPFYFSFKSAYYIAYLSTNQDDLTHGIQIEKYTGTGSTGRVAITSTEFPFSTDPNSPRSMTVQILSPLLFTTTGWLASNIVLTDGTGKSILPLITKSYRIVFTTVAREVNFWYIWKEADYNALVNAFGTEIRFEFIHNYTLFRIQLARAEDSQQRQTIFEVFRNNAWSRVTSAVDFFVPSGDTSNRFIITADVFADGVTATFEDTAVGKALQLNFNRPFEINSVLLHATEFAAMPRLVTIYDCDGKPVANSFAVGPVETYLTNPWLVADFRRRKLADDYSGPRIPFPIQYGPHTSGVLTRYIEIIAKDDKTPLFISQIVAINACGRNVAFQKDVYATSQKQESRPESAVDGIFEDELTPDFAQNLIYDAYKPKDEAQSFVSLSGSGTKLLIDLGRFVQKSYTFGDRDSICENQVNNAACQVSAGDQYTYNHEINCVIFITPKGRVDEAEGVIIRLIDANGFVVGVQRITRIVKLFGVDFLDFRRDTTRNLAEDLVERPRRSIKAVGCGIMTTFVRVEQVPGSSDPVQLSQIFVIDITGKNVALYKPTRATDTSGSTFDLSFRAVDGKYYVKSDRDGYMSRAGPGKSFEVNLGCPTPVTKVYIVNINTGNATRDERRLSNMRIKLYNESRDLIAVQTLTSSRALSSNPGGVRSLILSNPGDARTISVAGVDMKARFFAKKYEENLMPAPPNIPPSVKYDDLVLTTAGCDSSISVDTKPSFTIGPNRGIMAHFLRVYNPNSYIQISQALIFDGTGSCINRQIPLTNVFATNALPERYPELAIDCCGGFFHVNRPDSQCYISERKPYEYWQVQVASASAQEGREIIAVKYFPPKTNRMRNVGLRFQLLDRNQNVLSEYVFKEETGEHKSNEVWVDFRVRGPNALEPLIQYCFPRLQTVASGFGAPVGIEQDSQGTVYVSDIANNLVFTIPYSASSDWFGSPITLSATNMLGITITSQNRFYSLNSGSVTITNPTGNPVSTITLPSGFTGPAYDTTFDSARNILYVSYANGVASFNINLTNSTFTQGTFRNTNLNGPAGLVIRNLNGTPYLYVAVKNEFRIRVYNLNTGQEDTEKTIGKGIMPMAPVTTLSETPTELLLKSPVGLALDAMNNLYFSDEGTDSIYVTAPDISAQNRPLVYRVAGTGTSGFSEDVSIPATRCMLQKPQNLIYHRASGDILFADMGNGRIRRIRTLSLNRRIIPLNPVTAPVIATTTLPQGLADPDVPAEIPIVRTENRDRETLRELRAPARIETLD